MLETMPSRVGVIVRTKDRPEFLRRALYDIAAQSYSNAEVVVVNDGGDAEVVRRVVEESSIVGRTRVVDVPRPGGRCAAANAGVAALESPYVVLHDDDDLWHRDFLARTVESLDANAGAAGVMVATEIVYEEQRSGEWVETSRAPFWAGMASVSFTSLLEVNRAVPISFLYRRSLHDEVGYYDETLDAVEDWEFYLRVTARQPVVFLGGTPLAYWMQRPTAVGANANSMFEIAAQHEHDDAVVRDRALREWVAENGPGLPLYIAGVERRILDEVQRMLRAERQRGIVGLLSRQALLRRLRRMVRGS